MMDFFISCDEILERIDQIDPVKYGKTRNFHDGAITYLSPFISRGVISTQFVMEKILAKGYKPYQIEKFLQELAWRDYWQQIWISKGKDINTDLKRLQPKVENHQIAEAIVKANTGVEVMDIEIEQLYQKGYMHNHMRMYVAAVACNMAKNHWKTPAQWMYYHLLDGDWASNALSWQWVAGANSNKKYVANQQNINKYFDSQQRHTFLDVNYAVFENFKTPEILKNTKDFKAKTPLPPSDVLEIDASLDTCIYNYYNLDPLWKQEIKANRILLLEPALFKKYPISQNCVDFMMHLAKNIEGLQVYVGGFDALEPQLKNTTTYFKEHPLNKHYRGKQCKRDWMFKVQGYYPSFFGFWKKCKKEFVNREL